MDEAILSVIELGRVYGLQIRNELQDRLQGSRPVNAGHVYRTLERLHRQGFIISRDRTPDDLPLYALTPEGTSRVQRWKREPRLDELHQWNTMVQHVLAVASLPNTHVEPLLTGYESLWAKVEEKQGRAPLTHSAHKLQSRAAREWLALVKQEPIRPWPLRGDRPKKGRPAKQG